jgi:hypothetical protein
VPSTLPRILLLASLLGLAPAGVRAADSYDSCTGFIRTLPATITTPGVWCLDANLLTSITTGNAIRVAGNDITVDCNGHRLDGSGGGVATDAKGIGALGHDNITVRACTIVGFRDGVSLLGENSATHRVEDNHFISNRFSGMIVAGDGSTVRRNVVRYTGGSLKPSGVAYGIRTIGSVEVRENIVNGVYPTADAKGVGHARGIYAWQSNGGSIRDNIVRGMVRKGTGSTYGVYALAGNGPKLRGNDITGVAKVTEAGLLSNSYGVICLEGTGFAQDNFVTGMARSYYGCTDAGDNFPAAE